MRAFTAYQVALPTLDANTYNFNFSCLLPNGNYSFQFSFDYNLNYVLPQAQQIWRVYVSTPTGETLSAIVAPNDICGINNVNEAFYFQTSLSAIGLNDLANVSFFVLVWTQ